MPLTFNNTKTCEVFAEQSQEKGKGSHLFFENNIIYSYGYHFPIACIMKKENIALFNSASYSITTSKHKSYVLRALNYYKVFIVPCVVITDNNREQAHQKNIEYLKEEIKKNFQELKRSRKYKEMYKYDIKNLINTFNDYIDIFDLKENKRNYDDLILTATAKEPKTWDDYKKSLHCSSCGLENSLTEENLKDVKKYFDSMGFIPSIIYCTKCQKHKAING